MEGGFFSDSPTTSNNLNVISANQNKENKGFTLTKESPWWTMGEHEIRWRACCGFAKEFLQQQAGSLLGLTANSDDLPIDLKYPYCRYWSKVMVIIQTSRWPDYRLFFSIPGMKTHLKHGKLVLLLGSETSHQRKCDVISACELFKVPMVDDSEWDILEKYVYLY